MSSFSQRHGFIQKEITLWDALPPDKRLPIFNILKSYSGCKSLRERIEKILDPYGIDPLPEPTTAMALLLSDPHPDEEDNEDLVAVKRLVLSCPWYRIYDIIEDAFQQLHFYESELCDDPDEEPRAYPFPTSDQRIL